MDKKKTAGFLLIELLLALALLLLLVPVFFGVMAAGLKALSLSEKKTVALYWPGKALRRLKKGILSSCPSGKQPVEVSRALPEKLPKGSCGREGMQPRNPLVL